MVGIMVKTWVNYGWIDDCSRSLNSSRILKFEKEPDSDPDPDWKILEQERSRSLKKWLRPNLFPYTLFLRLIQTHVLYHKGNLSFSLHLMLIVLTWSTSKCPLLGYSVVSEVQSTS